MHSTSSKPSGFRRVVATCAAAALAVSLPLLGTAGAQATPSDTQTDTNREALLAASFEPGRYLVELRDAPISTYEGGVQAFSATADAGGVNFDSPQAQQYGAHLEDVQDEVAADAAVSIDASLTATYNGFIANITGEQAAQLAQNPLVVDIVKDELLQLQEAPATDYLELEAAFNQIGGWDGAGEGIVVGIVDSGIAPENPFFAGDALSSTPSNDPYLSGSDIIFNKADGGVFTGACVEGVQFDASDCNTKLISAKYYVDGFGADRIGDENTATGEFLSARDGSGHGSHTASTSAGNADVPITSASGQDLGTMSGVAPAAKIAAYKVCWEGQDPTVTTDDGCATTDLVQAIEDATTDGVDVINFSIGGGAASSVYTAIDRAFFGASAAGVFVAASAGNSGPGSVTADHASPWYATVAASTVPNFEGTIVLPDAELNGASTTVPLDGTPITGEFVYAGDIAAEGADPVEASLCFTGTLDAEAAEGKIVLCDRGQNDRVAKSATVAAAGGIGSVLVNVDPGSIDLDDHSVPTVHVDSDVRDQLLAVAATGDVEITLKTAEERKAISPQVAGFSSRGPMLAGGSDVIKPDLAAPGVGIIAAGPNQADSDATFVFMSGTSMAAPHVAGLGAAYLSSLPNASPAEVKSVLMTSAVDTLNAAGEPIGDAFTQGQGNVKPVDMFNAGFYFEATTDDYYNYLVGVGEAVEGDYEGMDASDLNLPSIGIGSLVSEQTVTRTATAINPGTYTVDVQAPAGVDVVVEPSTLTFGAAGETQEFTVTLNSDNAELGTWLQGRLTWSNGEQEVRQQIAVNAASFAADERIESVETAATEPLSIAAGVAGELDVSAVGLTPFTTVWDDVAPEGDYPPEMANDDIVFLWDADGFYSEATVGEDAEAFAVHIDSEDAATDYDLVVGQFDENLELVNVWRSEQAGSAESIEVLDPAPGYYAVMISDWAGVWGHVKINEVIVTEDSGEGDFDVTLADATSGNAAGDASTNDFVEPVAPGEVDAEVSWTGLEVGTQYFGVVNSALAGNSAQTVVYVDAQEDTNPTDPPEENILEFVSQPVTPVKGVELGQEVNITTEFAADPAPTVNWQIQYDGSDEWENITEPQQPTDSDKTDVVSADAFEAALAAAENGTDEVRGYTSTLTFTVDESVIGAQFRLAATQDEGASYSFSDATAPLALNDDADEPTDPTAPDPTDDDTGNDLPETGANPALWLLVLAAGLGLVGAGAYASRVKRS